MIYEIRKQKAKRWLTSTAKSIHRNGIIDEKHFFQLPLEFRTLFI